MALRILAASLTLILATPSMAQDGHAGKPTLILNLRSGSLLGLAPLNLAPPTGLQVSDAPV